MTAYYNNDNDYLFLLHLFNITSAKYYKRKILTHKLACFMSLKYVSCRTDSLPVVLLNLVAILEYSTDLHYQNGVF